MKKSHLQLTWLILLAITIGGYARPVSAAAPPTEACGTVNFYLYNALDEAIMIDLVNWTTGTRWLHALESNQSVRFVMPAGDFEFYIDPAGTSGPYWYISEANSIIECSKVAATIKWANGLRVLKLKEIIIQ